MNLISYFFLSLGGPLVLANEFFDGNILYLH